MQQQQMQLFFSNLTALPLTNTTRNGLVQFFHFGSTHYTTSQGLVLDVGLYTLAVNCPWQLLLPDGSSITHSEVYQRKRETNLPAPGTAFDWQVPGANLRDQRLKEVVTKTAAPVVTGIATGNNHSFTIYFTKDMQLTVTPEADSEEEMYWQLFSNAGERRSLTAGKSGLREE